MKTAFLTGPNKFEVQEIPDPTPPADGLVLTVKGCGLCGGDVRRWKAGPAEGVESWVIGHEVTGVVESAGEDVTRYKVGDRLAIAPDVHCGHCYYCERGMYNLCDTLSLVGITPERPGGYAEKMLLTGDVLTNGIVHRIPDSLSFVDAALSEPCSSVLATHQNVGTGLGDLVVVIGAGPMGCLHTVIAKARGARVIVSEPAEGRRKMVEPFEPDAIVDPFNEDLETRVRGMTDGVGADIVICANPVAATQTQAVEIVRKAGKVVLFGGLPKSNPMTTLDGNKIHYGEMEVIGAFSYHPTFHELALKALEQGLIPIDLLITGTYALDDINDAFEAAARGEVLKAVIVP